MAENSYGMPDTSVTLLSELGRSNETPRWSAFVKRYDVALRAFLQHQRYGVDKDDVVQMTYVRLIKALPNYHYVKGQQKRFRNWLLLVCANEAKHFLRTERRHHRGGFSLNDDVVVTGEKQFSLDDLAELTTMDADFDEESIKQVRVDLAQESTEQILKDTTIKDRDREIFRLLVLEHDTPESVAKRFGLKRSHVDKIKHDVKNAARERFKDMLAAAGLKE